MFSLSSLRKHLSTPELIRRDREVHVLGLHRLDHLPTSITKEILQDACRELQVNDVSLFLPALRKCLTVVRVVPQLQHVRMNTTIAPQCRVLKA